MPSWLKRLYDDDWYAPSAIVLSLFVLYYATVDNRWTIAGWPRPYVLSAVFGLVFAIGKYASMPGARWWGIPWLVFLILGTLINVHLKGWTAWGIISVIGVGLMLPYFILVYFFPHILNDSDEEKTGAMDGKPFLSLVLLFREARYLDATILAALASKAWGMPVTGSSAEEDSSGDAPSSDDAGEGETAFIVGDSPLYMAKHPQAFIIIHHFDRPYFDDPQAAAEDLGELRLRNAIAEHQAWTAVDVVHWTGPGEDQESAAYRLVGHLLAELADDNVLAVIDPAAQRVFAYDPETERKLRSDDPRAELREPYYAPVIRVADDDPAMLAAVADARRRWPEFVAAFESRSPDNEAPFTVKAPVGPEGAQEFIWIEVTGIESGIIYGNLGNEPANIPSLKLGDRVRVPVDKVNDWMCLVDDKPVGGFTIKVLSDLAKRGKERPT